MRSERRVKGKRYEPVDGLSFHSHGVLRLLFALMESFGFSHGETPVHVVDSIKKIQVRSGLLINELCPPGILLHRRSRRSRALHLAILHAAKFCNIHVTQINEALFSS